VDIVRAILVKSRNGSRTSATSSGQTGGQGSTRVLVVDPYSIDVVSDQRSLARTHTDLIPFQRAVVVKRENWQATLNLPRKMESLKHQRGNP
jgi:hypothetical protein